MAESISEGTLKQWQKKVGDHVEVDEEVATIETDKVSISDFSGLLVSFHMQSSLATLASKMLTDISDAKVHGLPIWVARV